MWSSWCSLIAFLSLFLTEHTQLLSHLSETFPNHQSCGDHYFKSVCFSPSYFSVCTEPSSSDTAQCTFGKDLSQDDDLFKKLFFSTDWTKVGNFLSQK